jgi:hypothetical protein
MVCPRARTLQDKIRLRKKSYRLLTPYETGIMRLGEGSGNAEGCDGVSKLTCLNDWINSRRVQKTLTQATAGTVFIVSPSGAAKRCECCTTWFACRRLRAINMVRQVSSSAGILLMDRLTVSSDSL